MRSFAAGLLLSSVSLFRKLVSLSLVWALVMSSMPAYAADARRIEWVSAPGSYSAAAASTFVGPRLSANGHTSSADQSASSATSIVGNATLGNAATTMSPRLPNGTFSVVPSVRHADPRSTLTQPASSGQKASGQKYGLDRAANHVQPPVQLASLSSPLPGQFPANRLSAMSSSLWPVNLNAMMLMSGFTGGQVTVFGPQKYIRTTGAPNQYSTSFSLPPWAISPFVLHIQNGNGTTDRVSSAWIVLNGVQIAGPSDFSQQVSSLDIPVTLAQQNTLQVTLASKPGSFLIISIGGQSLPIANAGPPQTVFVGSLVQLDGTGSTDQDGDPLSYSWSLISVPVGSTAALSGANTPKPTFLVDKPGTYIAQLIVSDGQLNSAPATVAITTINSPPVANAGPNQTVFLTSTVHLDGSGSTDVDGDLLTYHWSLITVPDGSTAQLSDAAALKPAFTADVKGIYVAQLIVNDGHANSAPATVTISTENSPPVANAGPNQTLNAGRTVNLDGSKSSDVDGDPLTFRWSFLSVPAGSTATFSDASSVRPSFFGDRIGTYIIQLVVNDGTVDSAPSTVTITTENTAPVADAGANQSVFVGNTVTLDGSRSHDIDGNPITYRWSLLTVPANSSAHLSDPTVVNPTFVADVRGTYVAQLIVNDGFVDSSPATVTISTLNSPPVANAGPAQTVLAGTTVHLNGSGSTDVDGDALTFKWSIISKPSNSNAVISDPTSVAPTFFADQLGVYVAQLIVNDGTVDSAPSTVTVTTEDSTPVANAGPPQTVPLGSVVTLDGSGSSDPDGQSLTYQWSLLSFPAGSTAVLANPAAVNPTFTADKAGTYVAQLIVNDGFLNSAPSTVTISTINSVPVANAGANQSVFIGTTVQLDGSASSDADGDPLTYRWSITVQPSGSLAVLSDSSAVNPTFVADVAGNYVAQLIVNDGKVDSAPSTVMIVVANPNKPPVVDAGPNQTITLPTSVVTLNGSVTDDGLPASGVLTIAWSQISGPAPVVFSSPATAVTQATLGTAGTYVLRLTASDGEFTTSADVTVTVNPAPINQPPVVSAGPGGTVAVPGIFALHGSATDDGLPSGTLTTQWIQVTGPSTAVFADASQPLTSVALDSPGTYVFRLTASDGQLSASSDVTVVGLVNNGGGNQAPFVDAGPDQIIALPNPAVLNGLAFDDGLPDGTLEISWSKVSGPGDVTFADPTNPKTTATFAVAGDYVLRLTASDSVLSSSDDIRIVAGQLNGTRSSKGNEFWLMFTEALGSQPSVFITGEQAASGNISVPGLNFSQNFTVGAGQIINILLPVGVLATGSENIQNIGIHIVADHEVTVYGLNLESAATDAYLGLPVTALGKEYINASYINVGIINGTEVGVVAAYDNTTVTVTPSQTTGGRLVGVPYSFVLHRGKTYQLRNTQVPGDLTGTIVSADKPVAVFGTHQCADIRGLACNHLVEQLPSTDTWGTHFVSVPLATRKNGDTFRIIGSQDNTTITINGQDVATVNRGEFYETLITQSSYIVADHPILVVQYSNGTTFDGAANADPFMIVVPPIEQYRGAYTVTTLTQFPVNFINVVIPTSAKAALQLDGNPVSPGSFTDVVNSGFSTAQLTVGTGPHRLASNVPFGVFVYGFGNFDGYGYTGGIALAGVPGGNLAVFPTTSTRNTSTQACTVASVSDADQNPLPAVNVNFTVTGANPQSGNLDTDSNGQARFCYTGTNSGSDSITVSIGTSTAAAAVTWQADAGNQAPQVFVPAALSVSRPDSLKLLGVVVDDGLPVGGALTQQWSKISGPGTVTFTNGTAAVATATFSLAGDYVLQLSASDTLLTGTATVAVHVTDASANKAPVITPIAAQTLDFSSNPNGNMSIAPVVTDDGLPIGAKLSYNWTVTNGTPSNVTIFDPTSLSTALLIKDSGSNQSFTLRLTVDDSRLSSTMNFVINTISANHAPVVSPGTGGTITLPTNTFALNGSVTDDGKPAGSTLTIQWQMQSGPAPVTFSSPNTAATTVTFPPTPGSYILRLTASDGQLTGSNAVTVTVNPANKAPAVSIAFVPSITLPTNVATLNGTVTDDGLPVNTLNISWTQISGPATAVIATPNQAVTQVTFPPTSGSYTFQLRADDTQLQTVNSVSVQVNAANKAPVVSAGPNQTIALPNATATLNGTVTDDNLPSGATVTQLWTQVSGPAAVTFTAPTQKTTNATFTLDGTYVLRLTASDTLLSASSDVTIIVLATPQNLPPTVGAGLPQTGNLPSPTTSLQLLFQGSVKDDGLPAGKPVTQQWSLVSGPATVGFTNPTSPSTFGIFTVPGTYVLRLTATDTQLISSADVTAVVNPPINQPPNVSVSASPSTISVPNTTATLTGTVTDDGLPNGTLTLLWTQISGPAAATIASPTTASTQVTMPVAGSYVFQLAASDSVLTTARQVSVSVTSNQPPSVGITAASTTIFLPLSASLAANATDDGKPSSQILYQWSQTTGPAPVTFSTPNAATTQVFFTVPGSYNIQILVSDTQLTATASVTLTVNPALPPLSVGILSPPDGVAITQPVSVTGNVSNASTNWKLEYSLTSGNDGDTPSWVQFASGTGQQIGAVLGTFDPTALMNGTYTIRLSATDANGQSATASVVVSVERNIKVGELQLAFNDLTVPLPGLPIQIIRSYDSRNKQQGDFGFSWTLGVNNVRLEKNRNLGKNWEEDVTFNGGFPTYCLTAANDRFVTVTFPDGRVFKFQTVSGPQCQRFVPITNPRLQFQQVATGPGTSGATLSTADGADLLLDGPVPGPVDIVDFDLNFYNPTLFKLTTAEGFTYIIQQGVGATSIKDPSGNTVTINAAGITSSNGLSVAFQRDAQNRITQITDATGLNTLKYSYNASGDLATFTDELNNVTHYNYNANHFLSSIVDARNITVFQAVFDSTGHLTSSTDGVGRQVRYTHDIAGHHETITDRNNNPTTYDYDNDGNIVRTTDALGHVTTATFDTSDNKLTETNALGKTSSNTYDAAGNRLTETDPLGHTTRYTYNGKHQVLSITDPQGHVASNTYDITGNLLTSKDALGNLTTYTYNAQGMPLTVKDAQGKTTTFVYDGNGRLTRQTDSLGNISNSTYDANGNKLTQAVTRTKADGTTETLTTQYQYDADNHITKTIYPDNTFTNTVYNAIGKPSDVFDALNRKTHYDYDGGGRVSRITYPDLTSESFSYDGDDRKLTSVDRISRVTSYTYDVLGRLTKTTYPDTSTTQTVYDAIGQAIQTIDARNHSTFYTYDDAGRRTSMTDALNNVTSLTYDNAGNQASITDALNHTTQFVYDSSNRRIQTIYPDLTSDSIAYDSLGRQISKTDQAGKVTQYGYDAIGRLTSVTQFLGGNPVITSYAYDELGNRISQTDANGHITRFVYDQRGRRTSRTLPVGMAETYGYDAVGNMTSRRDFTGHNTAYTYDVMNRLKTKTADAFFSTGACAGGLCGATLITYNYNNVGRRTSMVDASGTTSYNYDARDRILNKTTPAAGSLIYTYDAAGNMLTLKSSNVGGASMTYTYDFLNRLASVTDASGTTNYSYDAVGNLGGFTYANGVQTGYTYNSLNRLTQMQSTCATGTGCGAPGTAIASYAYTLGPAGNRLSVAELSGRTVTYGYDDLYRLTSESVSGAASQNGAISYQYDAAGNRVQRNSTVPAIPATGLLNYDANDRTSTDPYDANGNLLNAGSASNVYDFENRLVQSGAVKLVYDGDGNRVSETVAGVTTKYLVANQNLSGYAQVVDELQGTTVTRSYSYGLELISERQNIAGTPTTSFYGYDGHGSVRFLTSSTGAVTDTYDYDAFGNLLTQTGSTPNNYLFAGEQFDPVLGIYYNRARYYDQRQGRFWSMDRYEGRSEDPVTLHKYTYVGNEPVNRRDPSGREFDLGSTLGALQVQATLFVQNTAARFAVAFAAGGTALGRFYNQLGEVAENIAVEVAELLQIANPETIQSIERDVEELEEGGGQRFIDIAIRTSDKVKDILIEVKYKIPTDGEALERLVGQVNAALRSGNEVIVWALKTPTAAELENLAEELGTQASRIQVLSGVENLYNYVQSLLK